MVERESKERGKGEVVHSLKIERKAVARFRERMSFDFLYLRRDRLRGFARGKLSLISQRAPLDPLTVAGRFLSFFFSPPKRTAPAEESNKAQSRMATSGLCSTH